MQEVPLGATTVKAGPLKGRLFAFPAPSGALSLPESPLPPIDSAPSPPQVIQTVAAIAGMPLSYIPGRILRGGAGGVLSAGRETTMPARS